MSGAERRAALELHGLAQADRQWVLGRLPAVQRARIVPLLAELDAMGIRFDIGELAAPAPDDSPADELARDARAREPSARSVIREAAVEDVLRVLAAEPGWVANAVLALENWPWSEQARKALSKEGVVRGEPSIGRAEPPAGLAEEIVALFAARLRDPAAAPPKGGRNGHPGPIEGSRILGRFWPKAKQWLR